MIVPTMQSEELINSWWRSRLRYRFQITLPHPTIAELGICGDLLAFFTQSPVDFHDTRRNERHRLKVLNQAQTSGSKSGLIWKSGVKSRINFDEDFDLGRSLRSIINMILS